MKDALFHTNRVLILSYMVCMMVHLELMFNADSSLSCAFKVNCRTHAYKRVVNSPLNMMLFHYEQLGGAYYAPSGSTVLPSSFRSQLLILLLLTSFANHGLVTLIDGSPWVRKRNDFKESKHDEGHDR